MKNGKILISVGCMIQLPMKIVCCISTKEIDGASSVIQTMKAKFATEIFLGWAEDWGSGVSLDRVIEWLRFRGWIKEAKDDLDLFSYDRLVIVATVDDLAKRCASERITHLVGDSDRWLSIGTSATKRCLLSGHRTWKDIERELSV